MMAILVALVRLVAAREVEHLDQHFPALLVAQTQVVAAVAAVKALG